MDFQIPIGKNGDCYDRYLIRVDGNARIGSKIIKQCCEMLRSAAARRAGARPPKTARSRRRQRAEMKRSMEALIHHFKLYTEGFKVPEGEVYAAVECAQGEFGVYLVADGTNKPLSLQDQGTGLRASAGDGLHLPGLHAGGCQRDFGLVGYCFWRGGSVRMRSRSSCRRAGATGFAALRQLSGGGVLSAPVDTIRRPRRARWIRAGWDRRCGGLTWLFRLEGAYCAWKVK